MLVHYDGFLELPDALEFAEQERKGLCTLAELGIPSAEIIEIGTLRYEGTICAAQVMKRYVCASRDASTSTLLKILNERTVDQARRMITLFARHAPLHVEDLQFLFSADGDFVVADPLWVERRTIGTWRGECVEEVTRILSAAKYALAVRSGRAIHPASRKSIWTAAESWGAAREGEYRFGA